jgi:hypothetical protein
MIVIDASAALADLPRCSTLSPSSPPANQGTPYTLAVRHSALRMIAVPHHSFAEFRCHPSERSGCPGIGRFGARDRGQSRR